MTRSTLTAFEPGSYQGVPGRYDEATQPDGTLRPGWSGLATWLGDCTPSDLDRRGALTHRLLVAEGAGHAVQSGEGDTDATGGADRLDVVPFIVGSQDWSQLQAGLKQRAELFDALLVDLYGPQRVLLSGVVPPDLVLASRRYGSWALGTQPAGGRRVVIYGADVIRLAGGGFCVLADHTDVPLGAGWALLNRSVLTRVLPDLYRDLRVQSLAPYFVDLRAALNATTPAGVTNPRTVVLAADGDVDAYVDHSYLATRLGYNLVAGDDLVVRGGRVWLRSLSGLEEVSTVLRRVAELHADPLNVSPAGQGAVAGLGVVARAGQVGLANPFGTTLGGHLGLQPYLGEVCRMLLGEDLLLGSLATRWCGDPDQRAEVLEHLDRFVLHDTDPIRPADSVFATELDDASAAAWRAQIEKSPTRFVAQPRVAFAAGPSLRGNTLEPTVTMLRTQVVLGPQGPSVLPGALGRTIRDDMPALAQQGGIGRDVWVTADRAEPITVRLVDRPSMPQIDLRSSLPSRAAEALFWVGRNAERAEMGARVVRSLVVRFEQAPELLELDPADWLVPALAGLRAVTGGNAEPGEADSGALIDNPLSVDPPSSTDSAVDLLVDDVAGSLGDRSGAIGDSILHLVVAARSVREFLSSATWRVLGALDTEREKLATMKSRADLFAVSESLDRVTLSLLALSGLAGESIVRGPGWLFLDIGRRVDRALLTVDLLDATVASVPAGFAAEPLYETVLGACESLVAYRRRHRSDLDFGPLVDLLVADPTNPRGVAFQLNRIAIDITELPDRPARFRQQERARILVERLRVQRGVLGRNEAARRGFSDLLQALRTELEDLGADLMNTWFADRDEAHAVPGGAA